MYGYAHGLTYAYWHICPTCIHTPTLTLYCITPVLDGYLLHLDRTPHTQMMTSLNICGMILYNTWHPCSHRSLLRYLWLYIYPISTSILTLISSYFYLDIYSQRTVVIQLSEFYSLYYSAICFRLSFSVSSRTLK